MRYRSFVLGVLVLPSLAVMLCFNHCPAAAEPEKAPGIMVRPVYIELSLAPGETRVETIAIENDTDRPMPVAIEIVDFDMKGDEMQILPANTLDSSIAGWLSLPSRELILEPGELEEFPLSITRPEDDPPGCRWGFLVVETLEPLNEMGPAMIRVKARFLVTLVQFDPLVQDRSGAITGMDVRTENVGDGGSGKVIVSTKFANICEAVLKLQIRCEIRGSTGNCIANKKKSGVLAFPGRERVFSIEIPVKDLSPGEYVALTIIDYGGDNPVGGQWRFEIPEE